MPPLSETGANTIDDTSSSCSVASAVPVANTKGKSAVAGSSSSKSMAQETRGDVFCGLTLSPKMQHVMSPKPTTTTTATTATTSEPSSPSLAMLSPARRSRVIVSSQQPAPARSCLKTSARKGDKSVEFYGKMKIKFAIALSQYTSEERCETWYSADDYASMKAQRRATVKRMEHGHSRINNHEFYFRGLEGRTRDGNRRRQFHQVDASMAVLDAQSAGEDVAAALSAVSKACAMEAHERGLYDQRAALESVPFQQKSGAGSLGQPNSMFRPPRRLSCRAA